MAFWYSIIIAHLSIQVDSCDCLNKERARWQLSPSTIFMNDRSRLTIVHDLLDVRIYRHKAHHHA